MKAGPLSEGRFILDDMDWDDLDDVVDPLHPLHPALFADWVCPRCAEDGDLADLDEGRCPSCGSSVERL